MMTRDQIQTVLDALQNSQLFVQASSNINVLEGFGQQLDDADEAIALLRAFLAEPSEDEYLSDYSLIGDDGDYTPTDDEKFVIKDAIIGFMSPTPETKNSPRIEDIQQAVARGWCSDRNLLKRMDSDLATDIADQVAALLFTHPASKVEPSEPDKDLIQALTERDEYHDMADKLAEGIALHFDGDIGEHSSSNSPWDRALDLLDSAACAETMRLSKQAALAEPSEPVAWLYEAEYSSGGYGADYFDWKITTNISTTKGARQIKPLFTHPAPSKPAPLPELQREELLGAIARGWCTDRNMHKIMDSDLAFDIADSILAAAREKAK